MPGHIPRGDRIRNPLKAQDLNQPVEQGAGVVVSDRANNAAISQIVLNVLKI